MYFKSNQEYLWCSKQKYVLHWNKVGFIMIAKIIQLPYNREMAWLQDSVNNSTSHHYSKKTCRFGKYSCMNLWKRTPSYSTQPRVEYQYFRRILWIYIFFLMLVLLRRTSFLTNFYGLYFNQWCTYIFTYYISIVGLWGQLSCSASTPLYSDMLWALLSSFLL